MSRLSPGVLLVALSCLEPYEPKVDPTTIDMPVINGFINATDGSATVRLTHAVGISETRAPRAEKQANVSIELSTGGSWALAETDSGVYRAEGLSIDYDAKYTLKVTTQSGKAYTSDPIPVRKTPAIDSIGFGISNNRENLTILVSTHDPTGSTRYYSWSYVESYEYTAPFFSGFTRLNKIPIHRKPEDQIYRCWRTAPTTTISIGSSAKVSDDVIRLHELVSIPKFSLKISIRYSVMVRQRAVTLEEYNYLELLRKTTENLGSIFGSQPTFVAGNIHPANGDLSPTLGYFSGAEVKEQRYFVTFSELPDAFRERPPRSLCQMDTTCPVPRPNGVGFCVDLPEVSDSNEIVYQITGRSGIRYTFADRECADCRLHGGITTPPDFW